jgi:hypothetical protein
VTRKPLRGMHSGPAGRGTPYAAQRFSPLPCERWCDMPRLSREAGGLGEYSDEASNDEAPQPPDAEPEPPDEAPEPEPDEPEDEPA